jgi:hypothetical protein
MTEPDGQKYEAEQFRQEDELIRALNVPDLQNEQAVDPVKLKLPGRHGSMLVGVEQKNLKMIACSANKLITI